MRMHFMYADHAIDSNDIYRMPPWHGGDHEQHTGSTHRTGMERAVVDLLWFNGTPDWCEHRRDPARAFKHGSNYSMV
jgi:hypothetical protein